MEMERNTRFQQKAISTKRKPKQKQMEKDDNIKHSSDNGGINELPDDILINILSHARLKEAARTSVLARRWRYLWRFSNGILRFCNRDTTSGKVMEKEKFESWVNTVVKLHQARYIEGVVISRKAERCQYWFNDTTCDSLVYFAIQKEVRRFELNLPFDDLHKFPSVEMLKSHSHGVSAPLCRLRILRLANVDIKDEVVHYFLGSSCPNLEELCIHSSSDTKNLRVIDPPSLRVLEISRCYHLNSLKIFAEDLVSLTYRGPREKLHLEKIPTLRELTICDGFCLSFVTEPQEHWSYSVQLEKLVLDFRLLGSDTLEYARMPQLCSLKRLVVFAAAGRTTLFYYRSLIKASPQLREFRIESCYGVCSSDSNTERIPLWGGEDAAKAMKFVHRNLKVVEIGGYTGRLCEEKLVLSLLKIGPSIERVVIDTKFNYFDFDDCPRQTKITRNRAKMFAKLFGSTLPSRIKFIFT